MSPLNKYPWLRHFRLFSNMVCILFFVKCTVDDTSRVGFLQRLFALRIHLGRLHLCLMFGCYGHFSFFRMY